MKLLLLLAHEETCVHFILVVIIYDLKKKAYYLYSFKYFILDYHKTKNRGSFFRPETEKWN